MACRLLKNFDFGNKIFSSDFLNWIRMSRNRNWQKHNQKRELFVGGFGSFCCGGVSGRSGLVLEGAYVRGVIYALERCGGRSEQRVRDEREVLCEPSDHQPGN